MEWSEFCQPSANFSRSRSVTVSLHLSLKVSVFQLDGRTAIIISVFPWQLMAMQNGMQWKLLLDFPGILPQNIYLIAGSLTHAPDLQFSPPQLPA